MEFGMGWAGKTSNAKKGVRRKEATLFWHTVAILATLSGWIGSGPAIYFGKINAHALAFVGYGAPTSSKTSVGSLW